MKFIKSSKGYGAFEYTLLIAIVVIIALFFFLSLKNNDGTSAIEKGMDAVNDFIGAGPGSPGGTGGSGGGSSNIVVEFPGGTKPTFEVKEGDDLDEDQVKGYLTDNNITIKDKDGNIVDFSIENVKIKIDEPTYIQFDVIYEGSKEAVIVPGSINGLADGCVLASDSDFEWKSGWPWGTGAYHYTGSDTCVKVPDKISGNPVTSYQGMFKEASVRKVISNNKNVTNMRSMFEGSKSTNLNLIWLDTSNVTNMMNMFAASQGKYIDLSNFNTSNVENMDHMFYASQAISLDLSSFNTSNVDNMSNMFYESKTESLNLSSFNTSNVDYMTGMFMNANSLKFIDLRSFTLKDEVGINNFFNSGNKNKEFSRTVIVKNEEIRNVLIHEYSKDPFTKLLTVDEYNANIDPFTTNGLTSQQITEGCIVPNYMYFSETKSDDGERMFTYVGPDEYTCIKIPEKVRNTDVISYAYMFFGSKVEKVIPNNFNVANMESMFDGSKALNLDLSLLEEKTKNVTNMTWMFSGSQATSLDLSNFDTSNVTNMRSMFSFSQATSLDLSNFNTEKVTNMQSMFSGSQATSINLSSFDTSNVTNMAQMFQSSKINTLDLSPFDFEKVTTFHFMFQGAQARNVFVKDDSSRIKLHNSTGRPSLTIIQVK